MIPLADLLKNTRLAAGALFLLTVLLFYPAVQFQFLTYDDPRYVTAEDHVKQGLNGDTVRWAFTGAHHSMWHPMTSLSHLMDVHVFGMNAGAHHAVNILIHGVNAVLLFSWLVVTFHSPRRALLVAAVFAWHPLRVESVAWVSERKDVLCTMFWLLTLHAYTRYVRRPAKGSYLMVAAAFLMGVMSKPMIVTLPAVLLLLDAWPFRRLGVGLSANGEGIRFERTVLKERLIEKVPFFLLSMVLAAITYHAQESGDVLGMMANTSFADRAGNALVSYVRYLGLLVWPVDLSVLYPHPGRWPIWMELGALAMLVAITYVCWRIRRSQPWWLLGWAWYLVTLLPVIGLVQAGGAALANRYTYISTVGLILAAVWTMGEWVARDSQTRRAPALIAALAVVLGCTVQTRATLPFFHDTETLFREALRVTKANPVAHLVLGEALLDQQRAEEALAEFSQGILLTPTDAQLHLLAGRACLDLNRVEHALQAFQNALKLNPKLDEAEFQMARALRRMGRAQEARDLLVAYLEKHPENSNAWNNLGGIQAEQQDVAGAEKSFQNALSAKPESLEPRRNLIRLLAVSGRAQEALRQIEEALKYHPSNPDLWYQAGLLHEEGGRPQEARAALESAASLAPGWPLPKESLAWMLIQQPQLGEAEARRSFALTEEVVIAYGAEVPVRVRELQGCVLAANGRFPEAVDMAKKTRWVLEQMGDHRGAARLDLQIGAFQQNRRWLPAGK